MRPDRRLVDIDAPAGAIRDDRFAVFYYWRADEKLISPGHAVDVDFHYPEVGHQCAEIRTDGGAEAA